MLQNVVSSNYSFGKTILYIYEYEGLLTMVPGISFSKVNDVDTSPLHSENIGQLNGKEQIPNDIQQLDQQLREESMYHSHRLPLPIAAARAAEEQRIQEEEASASAPASASASASVTATTTSSIVDIISVIISYDDTLDDVHDKLELMGWTIDSYGQVYLMPKIGYHDLESNPYGRNKDYFLDEKSFHRYLRETYGWQEHNRTTNYHCNKVPAYCNSFSSSIIARLESANRARKIDDYQREKSKNQRQLSPSCFP